MSGHTGSKMDDLNAILAQMRQKRAEDMGDRKTTHVSKDEDNDTQPATEGSRSAENEADVKNKVDLFFQDLVMLI